MKNSDNVRIFLDLEYLYPGMTKEKGRPTSNEQREIVQIAAIKTSIDTGDECDIFETLCTPTYTKILPPFFIELTNITQEEVEQRGISFPDALLQLKHFCQDTPVWTFDADYDVLKQNCRYFGLEMPFEKEFVTVKPLLPSWGLEQANYSSGTLYKATGMQMVGHVHNAMHDVRSMSLAVNFFERKL